MIENVKENIEANKPENASGISLTIRYFAILREQRGASEDVIVTKSSTASELYNELSGRYNFTLPSNRIKVAINDKFDEMDSLLKNGDIVVFVPPVAGG